MKQNIYDNPNFFLGYSELRRLESGLNTVLEIPAMRSLIPPLLEKRVLDLGCGFGGLSQSAVDQKAMRVHGVDISKNMIEEAVKRLPKNSSLSFECCAIEDFESPDNSFDVVLSSLAVHYIENWTSLVDKVSRWLSPGGEFIVSMEHPICTAALVRWVKDQDGNNLYWPVDRYRDESVRKSNWFVEGVVKYHRTMETILNTLVEHGLQIRKILEPEAIPEAVSKRPDLVDQSRRPPFLLIKAVKT